MALVLFRVSAYVCRYFGRTIMIYVLRIIMTINSSQTMVLSRRRWQLEYGYRIMALCLSEEDILSY